MRKIYFTLLFACLSCASSFAQMSVKDSSIYTPLIGFSYGYYVPAGDMVKRFGENSSLQLNVDFKLKNYWMLGVNGSYFFGKVIKESLFDSISTSNGQIINKEGQFTDIRLYERGFTVSGTIGRMFAFKKPNPNSGIVASIGLGFIQHKIRIETIGNNAPQLSKEYKKGYDRLSNGFLLSENVGYMYLNNSRLVNIYFGLECMQGFTKSARSYDFELMKQDTKQRLDLFLGGKLTWILPLYQKPPQDFYIY